MVGEIGDVAQFGEYVDRNVALYALRGNQLGGNATSLSTPVRTPPRHRRAAAAAAAAAAVFTAAAAAAAAASGLPPPLTPLPAQALANWTRGELAKFLRKSPYSVSLLIAGVDRPGAAEIAEGEADVATPSLYWLDYLGNMAPMPFGAHGYCSYFILSTMDRYYKEGMSEAEATALAKVCIAEISERFMVDSGVDFLIKLVDGNGVRVLDLQGDFAPQSIAGNEKADGGPAYMAV